MTTNELPALDRSRLGPLAIIGLLLAFGLPELGLPNLLFADTAVGSRIGREVVWIGIAAIVLAWVLMVERLPLASIGLRRPTWATLGWGLVGTIALMATIMLTFAIVLPAFGLKQNMAMTSKVVDVPLWLLVTTPIVAGITEEIVYRGYAIERLTFLTGRPWLAGLIAGVAFLLAHWSWGAGQMIIVAFGTVILVVLYIWRRDLPCVIIAHILADLIGFSLARLQT